jgi:hypothetical protein
MIESRQLLFIYVFYIFLCVVSFIGLIWLTQFSFNAKVDYSVVIPARSSKVSVVEGIAITDSNLTMSKVAVVTLWIQIVGTFLFSIFKLSTIFK